MLQGKLLAGSAEPGLHFIQDQFGTVTVAQLPNSLEVVLRDHLTTGRPLHRLQDYRGRIVIDGIFHFSEVSVGDELRGL